MAEIDRPKPGLQDESPLRTWRYVKGERFIALWLFCLGAVIAGVDAPLQWAIVIVVLAVAIGYVGLFAARRLIR